MRVRRGWVVWGVALMMSIPGCGRASPPPPNPAAEQAPAPPSPQSAANAAAPGGGALALPVVAGRLDRKVVRTADLAIEVADPRLALGKVTQLAEETHGYVANTETLGNDSSEAADVSIAVTLRVPSDSFSVTLDRIHQLALHVSRERVWAEDVTQEFIDVSARANAQKVLEERLLDILKQARTVKEALEVETQLAQVRTEIEKLEGRRQFLAQESSLSTIKVSVEHHLPLVAKHDFVQQLKLAGSDAINLTAELLLVFIRAVGWLVPVGLVVVPFILLVRRLLRGRARVTPVA